ncbi:uncharacterized protein LOC126676334 [Mercurialis annua]|uniref:uncharacterized protein LOC126676334 n=1 Tax=Mercurialis annua TaxID=3986 RepID=UPI0021600F3E|nr:uncharacterized protein LOC126676334 [Mercurialis annua]
MDKQCIRLHGFAPPVYDPDSEYFSTRIHKIVVCPERYDHSIIGCIDYCTASTLSMYDIVSKSNSLGLGLEAENYKYYHAFDGDRVALIPLNNDQDVRIMALSLAEGEVVLDVHALLEKFDEIAAEPEYNSDSGLEDSDYSSDHSLNRDGDMQVEDELAVEMEISESEGIMNLVHEDETDGANEPEAEGTADQVIENEGTAAQGEAVKGNTAQGSRAQGSRGQGSRGQGSRAQGSRAQGSVAQGSRAENEGQNEDCDSDYAVSNELYSCSDSDCDDESIKPRFPEFNEENMDNPEFEIGMLFSSFGQFKEAVRNYGIRNRYVMKFKPNNKTRCKAYCKKGCPFNIWASLMQDDVSTVQIKSGKLEHQCTRDHNIRHVNPKWLSKKYLEQFRADPNWSLDGIMQAVRSNQKANISRVTAYRSKFLALLEINGDETEQMRRLNDYRLELIRTHPTSTIMFKRAEGVFVGMYVCLAPLRDGFLAGCRRVISVDGCWLKGLYGGQLLAAVGIDANDCTYPIAWCIVDRETKENWMWFLGLLADDLQICNSYGWCFMSDRQKVSLLLFKLIDMYGILCFV